MVENWRLLLIVFCEEIEEKEIELPTIDEKISRLALTEEV
jgi:hypothetical protein